MYRLAGSFYRFLKPSASFEFSLPISSSSVCRKDASSESIKNDENDRTLDDIAEQYPQAHGTLKNIMAVVCKELKNPKSFDITYTAVRKSKHLTGWTCNCNLSWPSTMSFSATAKTKQEASRTASLKVLQWLLTQGKIVGQQPVIVDKAAVKALKKSRVHLLLNPLAVSELDELLQLYQEDISEIIANVMKSPNDVLKNVAGKLEEASYNVSETYRMVSIANRNRDLKNRAHKRIYEDERISNLLIHKFRDEILSAVKNNQVVIIKGEPGCGKSTQVPQFILDEAALADRACDVNVMVTQPRRISAISLAERVAEERGEQLGDCIGYQVRFRSQLPRSFGGAVRYCSSGILLRILQSNPTLSGFSHVILDEAHERDVNTDMLLLLMRRLLNENPKLKLVIMSATINPELFQRYYEGAVALHIPGFTHPVQSYFLDDITQVPLAHTRSSQNQKTARVFHEEVADMIIWIHRNKRDDDGSILCFLPGWQDIKSVSHFLERKRIGGSTLVLPLHSRLSLDEQTRVFRRPPAGVRKIVLSTNVAETSVTIDDISFVVDTGIHKEERLSEDKNSAVLDDLWISQASVHQRRGRAGRVRPGESYHLYSKAQYDDFPPFPIPELHRIPLQNVVLEIKTHNEKERAVEFLSDMPEPPSMLATHRAVQDLMEIGALTPEETLTPLGVRISRFTMDPRLSRALIFATIFRCLDTMLTITSILSTDSEMFDGALDDRENIANIKRNHDKNSDLMAMSMLYKEWERLMENAEPTEMFCTDNMIRKNAMFFISRLRQQSLEHLEQSGMVNNEPLVDLDSPREFALSVFMSATQNYLFQRNWDFKNGRFVLNRPSVVTPSGGRASLSSDSVCHKASLPSPFLTYYKKQESVARRATVIRDASSVPVASIPLFIFSNSESPDPTVLVDHKHLPYILTTDAENTEKLQQLCKIIQNVICYFVIVEGGTKPEHYSTLCEYRNKLIKTISRLLQTSWHKTEQNELS